MKAVLQSLAGRVIVGRSADAIGGDIIETVHINVHILVLYSTIVFKMMTILCHDETVL